MNPILKIFPYGLVDRTERKKLTGVKKLLRNLLPYGIVTAIKKNQYEKRFSAEFLKNNYVSDLTLFEKNILLAYLLKLERAQDKVEYLEIGIYSGSTIRFLLDNSAKANFTGIDLFEDFKPADDNTHAWRNYSVETIRKVLGTERVTLIKGDSVEAINNLDRNNLFDIIFIDGNHTYLATKNDYEAALPLLKENGYLIFHNASPGSSQEDQAYLRLDGGPWQLTEEIKESKKHPFVYEGDRIRVFRNR